MQKTFEYCYTTQAIGDVLVEDIGNCCLKAFNDLGEEYYLITRTREGITAIFQFGPTVPNMEIPLKSVSLTFKRINYTESTINKIIDKFLNNPYANITQVLVVTDYNEILDSCIDIVDYLKQEDNI